jgi:uncharacterized membrane protein
METYGTTHADTGAGTATGAARGPRSRRAMGNGLADAPADEQSRERIERDERLSKALGWFSIGLGLAQLTAPRQLANLIGIENDDGGTVRLMRALGAREIASGVGILSQPRTPQWLWARVAGDVMDLALLGAAMRSDENQRGRILAATAAVAGVAALDAFAGARLRQDARATEGEQEPDTLVRKSITVNATPEQVYQFWRDFENLPRFMKHLESVRVISDSRSYWRATAPAGKTVEWEAEMTEDRPNEMIAWRSVEGSDVHHEGRVRFLRAPRDLGTEIHVEMRYDPPGGVIGKTIAKLFIEEPGQQVAGDLRRFKQVMEAGEVVISDATIGQHRIRQRPGQPAETLEAH